MSSSTVENVNLKVLVASDSSFSDEEVMGDDGGTTWVINE
jgi:hypothetical protein